MLHTIAAGTRDVAAQQTTYIAHAFRAGFLYQPNDRLRPTIRLD
jgi:NADH dehydrogenase